MFLLRRIPRLAAILVLVAILVVTAGPANAATGSVQVGQTATLVEGGTALDVPVTVSLTCDEGFDFGVVDVFVMQALRDTRVLGQGQSAPFACTGETQNLTVRVFSGGVFHRGPALANAVILECGFDPDFGDILCSRTDISTSEVIVVRGGRLPAA
jgi:hypothetical protein